MTDQEKPAKKYNPPKERKKPWNKHDLPEEFIGKLWWVLENIKKELFYCPDDDKGFSVIEYEFNTVAVVGGNIPLWKEEIKLLKKLKYWKVLNILELIPKASFITPYWGARLLVIREDFNNLYQRFEKIEEPERQEETTTDGITPVPIPADTKWEDVTIDFIDKENVKITVKGNDFFSGHCAQIGFYDAKRKKPVKAWFVFQSFAGVSNGINTENTEFDLNTLHNRIEEIKRRLKKLLKLKGIDGNPIPYKDGSWKPAFTILYNPNLKAHYESLSTQDDLDDQDGLDD